MSAASHHWLSDEFWCFAIGLVMGYIVASWTGAPLADPAPHSAAAYRAAQAAVEQATGVPCDYACKVMIVSMGVPSQEE
jgi:hypothetical protein